MTKPNSLPEVEVDPLGDLMLNFLIERDSEEAFLDFKETLNVAKEAPFAKVAKDIFAFSNYGGGFILIGFRQKSKTVEAESEEKSNFIPVGLPPGFRVDQADLQQKFNSYSNEAIELPFREFERTIDGSTKKFAGLYIPPSTTVLRPTKSGFYKDEKGRERKAFSIGDILVRRGTQSVPATKQEATWIKQRAEKHGYGLSILSGQPDLVQETIFSNLLEVVKLPEFVWTATMSSKLQPTKEVPVYVEWSGEIVTFNDPSNPAGPLWHIVQPGSIRKHELTTWLVDDDKKRVVVRLLNEEVCNLARKIGLLKEPEKLKFYYSCDGEKRLETWSPRFRSSSQLTVAQRIWAQQLRRNIFWHVAVNARFTFLGDRLFLRMVPTIQLTDDGRQAIFGPKEGTVITRLVYHRYNYSYLNNLLFWISKFSGEKEKISLAEGNVIVSGKLSESTINVGILFDRPAAEPVQEIPEIQIGEQA